MGCGNSKVDEEAVVTCNKVTSLGRINVGANIVADGKDEETDSSVRRSRNSFSSLTSERGILRRVLASSDKERGVEREREPAHNSQKSDSNSQGKDESLSRPFVKEQNSQEANMKWLDLKTTKKKDILWERRRSYNKQVATKEEDASNNQENWHGDAEENMKEDSIVFCQGSPSFRVYCIRNYSVDSQDEDDGDDENKNNSSKEIEKTSETQPMKRWRKGRRIRTALLMGGSLGMRNFLSLSSRSSSSSTSHTRNNQ